MDWIDLHLRADTADALRSACRWLVDEEGHWQTSGEGFAFDPIGVIVLDPGQYSEQGIEIEPPVFADGWHANLRCASDVAFRVPSEFVIQPTNPRRVWA